jgi:hypothetical protein
MDILEATQAYETWLGQRIPLIQEDLTLKHQLMRQAPFPFLRATFYRWVQIWPQICPSLVEAPAALSVGDLHIENFGTWRDAEGRLVWGINDFDEAAWLAFPNDLVRLAASAILAGQEDLMAITPAAACQAILEGYRQSLEKHGEPIVLAEHHEHLRELANPILRDPVRFWEKLDKLPTLSAIEPQVGELLENSMPFFPEVPFRIVHRIAGLGSLGRQRYTALAGWCGGSIAREAKRLTVSACGWENTNSFPNEILYQQVINRAIRDPDPFTRQHAGWLVRRIAPDCIRIELANLPRVRDERRLLFSMGWETANVHIGSGIQVIDPILAWLNQLKEDWLQSASQAMAQAVHKDWQVWKRSAPEDEGSRPTTSK